MKFKELLKSKNMTCYRLAKKLGVSLQTVYQWTWGRCTPNPKTVLQIVEILEVSAEEVLRCFIEN